MTGDKPSGRMLRSAAVGSLILVFIVLYWYGAVKQLTLVNTNMKTTDQSAYMEYSRAMVESDYSVVGGRNRMPIYPFIQSLFYRPGMSDKEFFTLGKHVNLVLSLLLLMGLAWICSRYMPWLETATLLLITAFTVFIFKAGYFQTELLFYSLNFCLFLLMVRSFEENSWQLAVATGVVAGAAHLTKASILPGLVIFLALLGIKWGWVALRSSAAGIVGLGKNFLCSLLPVMLVAIFFLITVYPYISTSKKVFGRYFYNVNSTFYMWYDSWGEAKRGTRAHGDRIGWPDMPPEEIPSMSKYLREHSTRKIIKRLVVGEQRIVKSMRSSYGYFKYLEIYCAVMLAAALWFWRKTLHSLRSNPMLYLFLVTYFVVYFLLSSWYAPIVSGNRIILAHFLPMLFVLARGSHDLLRSEFIKFRGRSVALSKLVTMAILVVAVVDVYFVLTKRIFSLYGGL